MNSKHPFTKEAQMCGRLNKGFTCLGLLLLAITAQAAPKAVSFSQSSQRKGPVRVDPKYPWHFIWQGTGGHYFFNGTTAFWLMGWREDRVINRSIERLHLLKAN